ncbi:MAG: histidine kinase [Saprospiraceae bacterium]|nr:histidine kinase [Saprospiraceae bacterium]
MANKPIPYWIAVLWSFFLPISLLGQHGTLGYTEHIRLPGGIYDNLISQIFTDGEGYLWLATQNGLKRYDEGQITEYKKIQGDTTSLIDDNVTSLNQDIHDRIWVGTVEGVCYLNKATNKFHWIPGLNQPDYACLNIINDHQGNVWFSIRDKGIYRFNIRSGKLTNFINDKKDVSSISANRIMFNGMMEDPAKTGIWVATERGINFYDYSTNSFYNINHNPLKQTIFSHDVSALTRSGNLLVYADNRQKQVIYYDSQNHRIVQSIKPVLKSGKDLFSIYQIYIDQKQNLWMSSYQDLSAFYHSKSKVIYELTNDIIENQFFTGIIFSDATEQKNGIIWFSTGNGLTSVDPNNKLMSYYNFSMPQTKNVNSYLISFKEDPFDLSWWMVTAPGQLLHYQPLSNQLKTYDLPAATYISGIDIYQGRILICHTRGAYLFNPRNNQINHFKFPAKDKIAETSFVTEHLLNGNELWFFIKKGLDAYAYKHDQVGHTWEKYPISIQDVHPRYVVNKGLIDRRGELLLGIQFGGLARFSKEKKAFEIIRTKPQIDFNKAAFPALYENEAGKIIVSSFDLMEYNPINDSIRYLDKTSHNGNVVIDDAGRLWHNTLNEYDVYDKNFARKISVTAEIKQIEESGGWVIGFYRLKSGKLLSFLKERVVLIDPDFVDLPVRDLTLQINRIVTHDTIIIIHHDRTNLRLNASQNSLTIHFGSICPPNLRNHHYEYRLSGIDHHFNRCIDQPSATYGNLDGGEYEFIVRLIDLQGGVVDEKTLYFHIDTPFYLTAWFKFIIAALILIPTILFFRYRGIQHRKIQELRLQSTLLEKDKTEIQYQNLINHLNPHFLFNSLTSLNSLIRTEPKTASLFLQRLSSMYRYILQHRNSELVNIEQELVFLKNYLDLQQLRFENGLMINIDIADKYKMKSIVPVTLQNLIENAIKHNTIDIEDALIIDLYVEEGYLIVKNNLQKKSFVETSNKQGLESLKNLYRFISKEPIQTLETETEFIVKIPLI